MRIFPKGLVHGFGQKLAIFLTFRVMQNKPKKSNPLFPAFGLSVEVLLGVTNVNKDL